MKHRSDDRNDDTRQERPEACPGCAADELAEETGHIHHHQRRQTP